MRKFFIIALIPFYSWAIKVELVEKTFFQTAKYEQKKLFLYKDLIDGHFTELLASRYDKKETERVMLSRARFVIPYKKTKLTPATFDSAQALNQSNRKTRFTRQEDGSYSAKRPGFFFTIEFTLNLKLLTGPTEVEFFQQQSGLKMPCQLLVQQKLRNYDQFLTGADFLYGFFPLNDKLAVVEVIGQTAISRSVPDFIQNKMKNDYKNKILHFRESLIKRLNN